MTFLNKTPKLQTFPQFVMGKKHTSGNGSESAKTTTHESGFPCDNRVEVGTSHTQGIRAQKYAVHFVLLRSQNAKNRRICNTMEDFQNIQTLINRNQNSQNMVLPFYIRTSSYLTNNNPFFPCHV